MGCRQPVLSLPSKPSPPLPPLFLQRQEFSTTEVSPARQDVRILCTLPPALLPDWIPRGAMPADVTQGRLSHTTSGDTVLLGCWQRSLWWSHHSPIQGSASQPTHLWGSNGEAIKQNWGTLWVHVFLGCITSDCTIQEQMWEVNRGFYRKSSRNWLHWKRSMATISMYIKSACEV